MKHVKEMWAKIGTKIEIQHRKQEGEKSLIINVRESLKKTKEEDASRKNIRSKK